MEHDIAMLRFLLKQPPHVIQGLILDPVPGVAYHISPNTDIENFSPRKIQRTMEKEDEIVHRVCTGVTLLDCIRGYAVMARDFIKERATCAGNDDWLGGYCIYAIPYDCSVLPKPDMAPMSRWCAERWLVDYLSKGQIYPHQKIGKMFVSRIKVADEKRVLNIEGEVYIHIEQGTVPFDQTLELLPGYHRVTLPFMDSYHGGHFDPGAVRCIPIDKEIYESQKDSKASLLSYPSSSRWAHQW